ncbi:MAG TPA: hypothetical protein VEK08_13590 [Planctomycetota bacterium]|nr:hypothetical protein [Planctomycetota bacterium]
MRLWHLSALVAGSILFSPLAKAGEVQLIEIKDLPVGADPEEEQYLKKKLQARQEVMEKRRKLFDDFNKTLGELKDQREKVSQLGSATVTIDEETKTVTEPGTMEGALGLKQPVRDPYEVNPDDFQIVDHDRWSINLTDFNFDPPQYIVTQGAQGSAKKWFGFSFTVINSTPKKRRIAPQFVAVTNKGVFNHSVTGFAPERAIANSLNRPLVYSEDLRDKSMREQNIAPLESISHLANYTLDPVKGGTTLTPMSTFEPGQTRWGAALWSNFSDEFTELKIIVHGLSNAHRYDEKLRRVLVLTYERLDDEFHVQRSELKLKDRRWEYLWMWDQDISVPLPGDAKDPQIKVQTLKTPAGADKVAWAFPFLVKNSTRSSQSFAINSVAFSCPIEVDVGGTKVPVEVKIVDDGRSTIYKAQLLKALGKESPKDRYELNKTATEGSKTQAQRRTVAVEAGRGLDELWAVFDSADVDWDDVRLQVESLLTEKMDKKAASKQQWEELVKKVAGGKEDLIQKNPGFMYDPRRALTADEFKSVQEQVTKGITGALDAAKAKKTVTAYFDCTSGLSTGKYRVSRSYRQPGVVQEEWLKAWEELDKAPAAQ